MKKQAAPVYTVARTRLENVQNSSLSADVKAGLATAFEQMLAMQAVNDDASIPPRMLLTLNDLHDGETIVSVDLMLAMLWLQPDIPQNTLKNVGVTLRSTSRSLGRLPAATDFPPLGRINLFATVYWGGVDAWSAGAAGRAQKPKRFWFIEANQLDVLRAYAEKHPGRPITTFNLSVAGYAALAIALRSVDLSALVAKAGLGCRTLRRDPKGPANWDAEAIVDSYVALCRTRSMTLSSSALAGIGGVASSLRGHAKRIFGSFGAMVEAARKRAPNLQPLNRPEAKDGTPLDSWSEVAVWNALLAALPKAELSAHVVLPGETSRSADILVSNVVWVEVLMLSRAEMSTPTSRTQKDYARKFATKAVVFERYGIQPVLVEPADVNDPARLAQRVAEIAARLGTEPLPPSPPSGRQIRAKGHWSYKTVVAAVDEVAKQVKQFPTHAQLTAAGYGHAVNYLKRGGMRQRIAAHLGLRLINEKGLWSHGRIVAELLAWVEQHGQYPSVPELIEAKRSDLLGAIHRLGRGKAEIIRAEVETLWGKPMRRRRMQDGSYATLASIGSLLRPLAERIGRVPTRRECAAEGLGTAWDVMSRRWGVAALAAHLDLPTASEGRRKPTGPRLL